MTPTESAKALRDQAATLIDMLQSQRDLLADTRSGDHRLTMPEVGGIRRVLDSAIAFLARNADGWMGGSMQPQTGDAVLALIRASRAAIPFLMDEAGQYEDDGRNEPLETVRTIESAIAQFTATPLSAERPLSSASSGFEGDGVAALHPTEARSTPVDKQTVERVARAIALEQEGDEGGAYAYRAAARCAIAAMQADSTEQESGRTGEGA